MSIWEKLGFGGYRGFSREAEQLLQQAVELAGSFGCSQADTGHLLLAMLQQEQGAAARFLNSRHISEQAVRRQLAENRRGPAQHLDRHAMAPDLRRTMDYALIGAQNAHVSRAEPEHLLCAMLEDDGCAAGLLLAEMGVMVNIGRNGERARLERENLHHLREEQRKAKTIVLNTARNAQPER